VTSGRATTAVIIAQDEAERIGECVRSVRRCVDEVVVVDGGSRDGTPDLAKALGCRVVHNAWPG